MDSRLCVICSLLPLTLLPPPAPPPHRSSPVALLVISPQKAPSPRELPQPPVGEVLMLALRIIKNAIRTKDSPQLAAPSGMRSRSKRLGQGDTSRPMQFTSSDRWTWGHDGLALSPQTGTALKRHPHAELPADRLRFLVSPHHCSAHPASCPPPPSSYRCRATHPDKWQRRASWSCFIMSRHMGFFCQSASVQIPVPH